MMREIRIHDNDEVSCAKVQSMNVCGPASTIIRDRRDIKIT